MGRDERHGVTILRAQGTRFDKKRFAGRATNYITYFLSACWAGLGTANTTRYPNGM